MEWNERRKTRKRQAKLTADSRRRYLEAKAQADAIGGTVGGGWRSSGEPVYFVVPPGAGDDDAARIAFKARMGRPMTADEEFMASLNRRLWRGEAKQGAVPAPATTA